MSTPLPVPRFVSPGLSLARWVQVLLLVVSQVIIFILDHWYLPVQFQGVILHAVPIMLGARLPRRAAVAFVVSAVAWNGLDDVLGDEGFSVAVSSALLLTMIGYLSVRWVTQERVERQRADENERLRAMLRAEHERVLETQRDRQLMLAMVSHEVAQPLSHVQVEAAILQSLPEISASMASRHALSGIARGLERLDLLVQDLLDLAQQRSDGLMLRPEPVALAGVVRRVLDSTDGSLGRRIAVDVPPHLPRVLADPRRVEQILTNLLANAAKYAPADTLIRIAVQRGTADLTVSVRDEGPGIPEAARQRIFEPFVRLRQGQAGVPGQGLGLAMCRLLVDAHGGRIWVEPRPTLGTDIRFTLPIASARVGQQTA